MRHKTRLLKDPKKILRILLDSTPESIFSVDRDGRILIANQEAARRVKKNKDELIGMNLYTLFPKEVADKRKEAIEYVFEKGESLTLEDERDGRYFRSHIVPVFDEGGFVEQVLIVAFDITERKKIERQLETERAQLLSIFDSIDEIIYVSDIDTYEVIYANEFLKRILGKDPVGKVCYVEFQGLDHPCDFCTNDIIKELSGRPYKWEYYNPILKRYYEITDRLIKWPDGRDVRFELAIDITERKNAEIALKISEELYRTSLSRLREGFVRTTPDGRIIMANPAFAKMLGYSSTEELLASVENVRQLYADPSDRDKLLGILKEKGYVEDFICKGKRKDGTEAWVSMNVRAEKDESGQIAFIEGTLIDITEKIEAERKLEEEKRKFQVLVETCPLGIVLADGSGKYLYVNSMFTKITGYTLEDVPDGKTFTLKAYPDHTLRAEAIRLWKEDVKRIGIGEFIARTLTVRCKDGSFKRIEIRTTYLAEGLYILTFEDVTEKERNETLLRESEKKFRSFFENAKEGIFASTLDGRFIMANPAYVSMLGYSSFEELKESVKDIKTQLYVDPLDRDRLFSILEKDGSVVDFETRFFKKDGSIMWASFSAWYAYDEKGRIDHIEGILEDITEKKKREEEMALLREQFLQAQKMEAIGRLAGGIAHDFNNILTVIMGTCELAKMSTGGNEKLEKYIESIRSSAEKASSLTKQLLAYSRKQLLQLQVIDLNKLIAGMEDMLKRLLGEDIEVITYFEKDLAKVTSDPVQMQQVIINLAVNAKDAMPNGGKLIIETYNVEMSEDYAKKHFGFEPGKYVMLSITDTGSGIPKEILPHIFEPFFTTKEKGEGTGLGLSTVYGIVKQLGGHIHVYSEVGRGTTFKIYLPQSGKEAKVVTEEKKVEEKELRPSEKTILLIEDDENVLSVTAEMLRSMGYKVLEAQSEEKAVEVAKNTEEKIDLILTDVVIPGIKAPALTVKIKKLHPEAQILFMSGYTENAVAHHGIIYPGVNFIQKPFSPEQLHSKIQEVLKKQSS